MRAWGGQGRQLAGLCQAESYLLEDMGIQDAPYLDGKRLVHPSLDRWFMNSLPSLYFSLREADFLLRNLRICPDER